jgi:arylsulfatase A-like enzyme
MIQHFRTDLHRVVPDRAQCVQGKADSDTGPAPTNRSRAGQSTVNSRFQAPRESILTNAPPFFDTLRVGPCGWNSIGEKDWDRLSPLVSATNVHGTGATAQPNEHYARCERLINWFAKERHPAWNKSHSSLLRLVADGSRTPGSIMLSPRESVVADRDRPGTLSPLSVVVWSAWLGLVGGTAELLLFLLKCHYLEHRFYNVGRHYPWMYPVAGVMVVGALGAILAVATWIWPKHITSYVNMFVLSFTACAGILFVLPLYTVVCLLLAAGLAVQTSRRVTRRLGSLDRFVQRSLVVLVGLLIVVVAGVFGREFWAEWRATSQSRSVPKGATNVLLIVLDTVRADRLSAYGYPRKTSPRLEVLASRGVRFDLALATAPWTGPSHAGMFTGRFPHDLEMGWSRPLESGVPTLAEVLSQHGYATGGFAANTTYCSYETGLNRGFAHYEDYDVTVGSVLLCSALVQRSLSFLNKSRSVAHQIGFDMPSGLFRKSAERLNRDVLAWLSERGDRPFFAFLNYYDAHHPYLPPEPPPAGEFGATPTTAADYQLLRKWWGADKRRLAPRELELARDSYDRCIAYLDNQVGCLLAELERRGELKNTLVVITADHGEHLGEHRLFGHGCSLFRTELHVPLIIVEPRGRYAGRSVHQPVSLRNLPATICDRLGFEHESPFPGHSLARYWTAESEWLDEDRELLISELETAPGEDPNHGESPACQGAMRSAIGWGYHYIRRGDGQEQLFDLSEDSAEERDLSKSVHGQAVVTRFRSAIGP